MLHALGMLLLNGVGLFGATGVYLPDHCGAAVLHLCYDGSTVGFGLLDAGDVLSFCFTNKHCSVGLSFPGGSGAESLGLFNGLSDFQLILMEGHLKVQDLLPPAGIKGGSSHQFVPRPYPPLLEVQLHPWGMLAPSPKVLTGREISSRVRSSGSASSGTLSCGDI